MKITIVSYFHKTLGNIPVNWVITFKPTKFGYHVYSVADYLNSRFGKDCLAYTEMQTK